MNEPLMSRIPISRFIDLDEETQLQRVEATAQVRYSHWEESRQKQQKKTSGGKKKSSGSKSKSKNPEKEAEKMLSKLTPEQLEKLKKEAGL